MMSGQFYNQPYRTFPSDVDDTWPPPGQAFFLYIDVDHLRSSNLMTEGQKKSTHNGIRFVEGEVVQRVEYTPFGKERYVRFNEEIGRLEAEFNDSNVFSFDGEGTVPECRQLK